MAEVLSQQQIDELLGNLQSGSMDIKEIEEQNSGPKVKEYDFTSPKKFTREQIRFLQTIFENFARLLSLQFSGMLRMSCQATVVQVEEEEYREFENALSDSLLISVMGLHSHEYNVEDKHILVEMSRPVSFCILDRMLGGDGSGYMIDRDYTEIELSLLQHVFKQTAALMKDAWSSYQDVSFSMDSIETSAQTLQFIQPDESAAIVVVEVEMGSLKGNINVCLPAGSLEEIFKGFNSKYMKNNNRRDDPKVEKRRRDSILAELKDTPLTVSAILGETQITLRELLDLRMGDVILLNTQTDGSLVVKVEKLPWFTGTMGTRKKHYAVKIDKVL